MSAPIRLGDIVRFEPSEPPLSDVWNRRVGREFVVIGEPDGKVPLWDPEFRESGGGDAIYVDPESVVLVARAVPVAELQASAKPGLELEQPPADLLSMLRKWFDANLTYEHFESWLDEDFAAELLPAVQAHVAAEVERTRTEADKELDEALRERDETEAIADRLAYSIAPQEVIGEHSSGNFPWLNALDLAPKGGWQAAVDRARAEGADEAVTKLADWIDDLGQRPGSLTTEHGLRDEGAVGFLRHEAPAIVGYGGDEELRAAVQELRQRSGRNTAGGERRG